MSHPLNDPIVLQKVGRNLLTYQQIEYLLKRVIPFMHPRGSKLGVEALRKLQRQIKKQPLGDVMTLLLEAVELHDPSFAVELNALISARNDLVHGLILLQEAALTNADGSSSAVSYLDDQYGAAVRFKSVVLPMYEMLMEAFEEMRTRAPGAEG